MTYRSPRRALLIQPRIQSATLEPVFTEADEKETKDETANSVFRHFCDDDPYRAIVREVAATP
jgi:hypothetical protein